MTEQSSAAAVGSLFANVGAEQALLGGALVERGRLGDIDHLDADVFTKGAHRIVFETIVPLLEKGQRPDIVLLADGMRGTNVSLVVLAAILEHAGPTPDPYIRIVRECRLRRRLDSISKALEHHVWDPTLDARDVLSWLRRQVSLAEEVAR